MAAVPSDIWTWEWNSGEWDRGTLWACPLGFLPPGMFLPITISKVVKGGAGGAGGDRW